jgi:hypothetical protein
VINGCDSLRDRRPHSLAAFKFTPILFGGGIGAIIDHNKGTAYTYPLWIQIVMSKLISFDRRADAKGKPVVARKFCRSIPVAAG